MPTQVQRFCCNVCTTEYRNFNDAMNCEMSAMDVSQRHQVGDIVSYEDERNSFGTRFSYATKSGKVLFAYIAKHNSKINNSSKHVWIYVIEDMRGNEEVEATYIQDEFGRVNLVSLSEWKYLIGYAEQLKIEKMCIR